MMQTALALPRSQGAAQIARVPAAPDPDDAPERASGDSPPPRRLGDPVDEPRVPRGCHPLVFGVVMATIQLAITVYFMQTC